MTEAKNEDAKIKKEMDQIINIIKETKVKLVE